VTNRVVIIDADNDVRALLHDSLSAEGYEVRAFATGIGIEGLLADGTWDLVLIDIDLPQMDGFTLTRQIRERFESGIIIISDRSDLSDRLIGLEVGADDYVVKPFEIKEVLARIRSLLRRQNRSQMAATPARNAEWFKFEGWTLNVATRALRDGAGNTVALTTGEYRLLETLVCKPGQILSRARLIEIAREGNLPTFNRSIDVGIMRLRRKIGDDIDKPRLIKTVRNEGYVFIARVATGTSLPKA
jgi:two-component system, OmpR family, response regulator